MAGGAHAGAAATAWPARCARATSSRCAPLPDGGLPDEVAPLVRRAQRLLQRLRQSLDTQRAFVADAAHELRSPLTALKLQLELLRARRDEADARRGARRASAPASSAPPAWSSSCWRWRAASPARAARPQERVDLAEVARQAVAETVPFAASRGSRVRAARAERRSSCVGDPVALALLVRNLVDNAVRYSPPGSRVELARAGDAGGADCCRSTTPAPASRRPSASACSTASTAAPRAAKSGTGLGLAIVRSVAAAHGATVALDRSPLGGLRVDGALRAASGGAS